MAEYTEREKSYGQTAKGQIAGILEAAITGAHHLEDIYAERIEAIMSKPNLEIESLMSLLGIDPGMKYSASLPSILRARLRGLFMTDVELEGHMDVHASTEESTNTKAESGFEGSGKVGWGPVSCGIKIHGSMSVESSRKRTSDYSAGIKWRIVCGTEEPPEALMKIVDALVRMQNTVTDMNMTIVEAEADALRQQAFDNNAGGDTDTDDFSDTDTSSDDSFNDGNDNASTEPTDSDFS